MKLTQVLKSAPATVAIAILAFALPSPAQAASVPLAAWDYVVFDGTNYWGDNHNLPWGAFLGHQIGDVPAGGGIESRVLLEFDLRGMSGTPVQSAVFSFPATDVKTFGVSSCFNFSDCPKLPTFDVYAYVGDGSVTTADYGLGTFMRQIVTPDFGEIITIDTTAFLNGLLVANEDFLGLVLRVAPGAEGGLATGLLSVAQGGSGIVVEEGGPIPEPATLALAGAALLGAAAARRRHPTIPA